MKHLLIALLAGMLCAPSPARSVTPVAYPAPYGATATNEFPSSMAGQLIFESGGQDYQGSGTVVFKRSVLTAAHNLWDIDNGWSTNVEFNRARSGDPTPNQVFARRIYVFAGYQVNARALGADSARAFSSDLGGIRFPTAVAGGAYAGWRADPRFLTGDAYNIALGYGADQHSGDELLFVEPEFSFEQIYGAFFENAHLTFEGGMSGGPIFAEVAAGDLRVVGVIVAGSNDPPSGGVRALNPAAATFLQTYLRY